VPIVVAIINHVLPSDKPYSKGRKPGGKGQDYNAVTEWRLSKVKRQQLSNSTYNLVYMSLAKAGMGPDDRKIEVRFSYTVREGEQYSRWEWYRSTVDILKALPKDSPAREICSITGSGKTYRCKQLDISGSASEIGRAIHENEELYTELKKALFIGTYDKLGHPLAIRVPEIAATQNDEDDEEDDDLIGMGLENV
jgi:hypothetical protein